MIQLTRTQEHSFVSNILNNNSVVIDFGLNHGEFSKFIANHYGCNIYGAEPDPELFSTLPSIKKLQASNVAIAANDAGITLSINEIGDSSALFKDSKTTKQIHVDSMSLEQFLVANKISKIDLLKVDIEGSEIDMFNSTSDTTLKKIAQITIEFHDFLDSKLTVDVDKILHRLKKIGFYIQNFSLDNTDVLCINQQDIPLSSLDKISMLIKKYAMGIKRIIRRYI